MLKDLKVSLYEVFGFLIPGTVCLLAILVAGCTVICPLTPFAFPRLSLEQWIGFLLGAYLLGHVVQALGNLILKFRPSAEEVVFVKGVEDSLPKELMQLTRARIESWLHIHSDDLDPKSVFSICDETVSQLGVTQDREMFLYREGFYRGLSISTLLLALSVGGRAIIPGLSITISSSVYPIGVVASVIMLVALITAAWLFWQRHRRFAFYRVRRAAIAFLVITAKKTDDEAKREK